jgi:hypothetical protein
MLHQPGLTHRHGVAPSSYNQTQQGIFMRFQAFSFDKNALFPA